MDYPKKTYIYFRNEKDVRWSRQPYTEDELMFYNNQDFYQMLLSGKFINSGDKVEIVNPLYYYLVVYLDTNWSDEFEINDRLIITLDEWYDIQRRADLASTKRFKVYFGTNQSVNLFSTDVLFLNSKPIAENTALAVKKLNLLKPKVLGQFLDRIKEEL